MGVFGSNPKGTSALGRHSALSSSRRRPVFASSSALIGGPRRSFAFAAIALTGPSLALRGFGRATRLRPSRLTGASWDSQGVARLWKPWTRSLVGRSQPAHDVVGWQIVLAVRI